MPASRFHLWLRWTLATVAASVLVFLLPGWTAAVAFGGTVGAFQALALLGRIRQPWFWVLASVVGWTLGLAASYGAHALGRMAGVSHLPIAVYSAVAAAVPATAQFLVLRREVLGAAWWIPANAAAWGLAFAVGFAAATGRLLPVTAAGALSGLIGGALTGAELVWLLHRRR